MSIGDLKWKISQVFQEIISIKTEFFSFPLPSIAGVPYIIKYPANPISYGMCIKSAIAT